MRDIIYNELMKAYAADVDAATSKFVADVNSMLAHDIAHYLTYYSGNPDFDIFRGVVNKIRSAWPGGETAEIVSKRIFTKLGLIYE